MRGWMVVAAAASLLLVGCSSGRSPDDPVDPSVVAFDDVTKSAGIDRETSTYDAAIGDADGDSFPDIYVGNHAAGAVLLRNMRDGTFRDVLPDSGIPAGGDQHGTGWGDLDNDGDLDLFVSLGAGRGLTTKANRLLRHLGGFRFEDVGASSGTADPSGRSRAIAWLDFDRDGHLDLVIANHASPSRLYLNRGDGTFEDASERTGFTEFSATRIAWADHDGDGDPDLLLSGTPRGLRLLRNEDGSRVQDVTRESGLEPLDDPIQGVAFGDVDNDGDLDLAMSHGVDFTEGVLADESGALRFAFFAHEEPAGFDFDTDPDAKGIELELFENGSPAAADRIRCGRTQAPAARFTCGIDEAASFGDPGPDPRFVVWRDENASPACDGCPDRLRWHLRWYGKGDHHLSGMVHGAADPTPVGLRTEVPRGAAIWRNDGGRFVRAADAARGLPPEAAVNGQAVQWADVDANGWLDLYLVDSGVDGGSSHNVLLLNDAGRGFVAVPRGSGATPDSGAGRGVGASVFDFDRDGRLDLFLTNGWGAPPFDRGPYRLLRNVGRGGHWLTVSLRGRTSNRDGLGAWLDVDACGRKISRYHDGGSSSFSQSVTPVHFGLGSCAEPVSLLVRWPSGIEQPVQGMEVDRFVVVEEPDA